MTLPHAAFLHICLLFEGTLCNASHLRVRQSFAKALSAFGLRVGFPSVSQFVLRVPYSIDPSTRLAWVKNWCAY